MEGLADSLDLVVIGAWTGMGRKVAVVHDAGRPAMLHAGINCMPAQVAFLSPFLLAAWCPETETCELQRHSML